MGHSRGLKQAPHLGIFWTWRGAHGAPFSFGGAGTVIAMPALPLTGGCNCGAVRYELTATPTGATTCHCTHCQRRTGTGSSTSAHAAPGTFRITRGQDHLKCWKPDGGAEKWFCAECGSSIYGRLQRDGEDDRFVIRMGTLDTDPGVRPDAHLFCDSAPAWAPVPDDGLPRFARGRTG